MACVAGKKRSGRLGGAALLLAGLWAPVAPAAESLGPYLRSIEGREPGRLSGRLFFEPGKPEGEVQPLAELAVLLLPAAPSLWASLTRLRESYRASAGEYAAVLGRFDDLVQEYRSRVAADGGEALVHTVTTGPDGRFELSLPGGTWVIVARHTVVTPISRAGSSPKPKPPPLSGPSTGGSFLPGKPPPTKTKEVSLWAYRVEVPAGGAIRVDLHDRNRWMVHLVRE